MNSLENGYPIFICLVFISLASQRHNSFKFVYSSFWLFWCVYRPDAVCLHIIIFYALRLDRGTNYANHKKNTLASMKSWCFTRCAMESGAPNDWLGTIKISISTFSSDMHGIFLHRNIWFNQKHDCELFRRWYKLYLCGYSRGFIV